MRDLKTTTSDGELLIGTVLFRQNVESDKVFPKTVLSTTSSPQLMNNTKKQMQGIVQTS